MGENPEFESLGFWSKHRYLLLILSSVVVAMGLVLISMALYFSSGAAQLDLSRPGYSSVADQVDNSARDFQAFSAFGSVDQEVIDEFETIFTEQATKATEVKAFSGDPLSPAALEIN